MKNKNRERNEQLFSVGSTFRQLRLKNGFKSAEVFSYENDINRTAYWRWENGENITLKNFFKLCKIHRIKPSDFFKIIESKSAYRPEFFHVNEPNEKGYLEQSQE